MPLSKDQKWTVGTGIAVVLAVSVINIAFRPHLPANPPAAAVSIPAANTNPSASPTAATSPITADPTMSTTPLIISTAVPMEK